MKKRRLVHPDQQELPIELMGEVIKPHGRIMVSQLTFQFTVGLSFTEIVSTNHQKHPERINSKICLAIPTIDDQVKLKRAIRLAILNKLTKQEINESKYKPTNQRPKKSENVSNDCLPEFER